VGRLVVLAELAVPLVRVGGHVAAIKGAKASTEIEEAAEALRLLHGEVVETSCTPTGTIVLIEKLRRTARAYPRRPGEPKRAPLGVNRDR
jgi:16S rRNA (guanine527-N7)-methyltransferase